MNNLTSGAFRLFRVAGITVYLHWLWFVVAYFVLFQRVNLYRSMAWNVAEYLSIFCIVLVHEFGHALACRQVGGTAERIILWPLGGVAFVNPPPRPGALLWSIAAGPLVNLALVPITVGVYMAALLSPLAEAVPDAMDQVGGQPDVIRFLLSIARINLVLLIFNLLPIYPLDGGQIVRALLWFLIGPAKSLIAACTIGLIGGVVLAGLALLSGSPYGVIMAVFIGWQSLNGFMQGWRLHKIQPGVDCINRALEHMQERNLDAAIQECDDAIAILQNYPQLQVLAFQRRGTAHMMTGQLELAVADYSEARRLLPSSAEILSNRSQALSRLGKYGHARADLEEALRLNPNAPTTMNNLAWLLATCPNAEFRDGNHAVMLAKRACEITRWKVSTFIGTLGAAYAEAGRMPEAITMQKKALESPKYRQVYGEASALRLQLYEAGQPYRDEKPDRVNIA